MKFSKKTVTTLTALIMALVLVLCLTACDLSLLPTADPVGEETSNADQEWEQHTPTSPSDGTLDAYVTDVQIVDGLIIVAMSDGTVKNIGAAKTTVENNNITIESSDASQDSAKIASRALLSTVGVECGFSITQYVSTGIFGGYTTREVIQYGYGSGVIYQLDKTTGDAYIITNYHVVFHENSNDPRGISERIGIYMLGDTVKMNATFVGGSDVYDIAVLRVEGEARLTHSAAQAVSTADSYVTVGERTMIVGNANGNGISVTEGIVSVDSEEITMAAIRDNTRSDTFRVIRSDASVNPGNSGGGMYNARGELIGIVNAKTVDEDTEGMGYAIPVDVATTIADKVIAGDMDSTKTTRRVVLGITVTILESHLEYDSATGIVRIVETVAVAQNSNATSSSSAVVGVAVGGLGDTAGLKSGDILRSITIGDADTREITRHFHITDEMLKARMGDTITVVVERDGAEHTLTVTVPTNYYG